MEKSDEFELDEFFNSEIDFPIEQNTPAASGASTVNLSQPSPAEECSRSSSSSTSPNFLQSAIGNVGVVAGFLSSGVSIKVASDAKSAATEQWNKHIGGLRSWADFVWPMRCSCDSGFSGARQNVVYFQTNYSFIFLVNLAFSIIMNPSSLVCSCALGIAWVIFIRKNSDPEWSVVVG